MREILDIIKLIQNTNSRNEKEEILRHNKTNESLQRFLKYVYDPFYIYGIQSKKLNKFLKTPTIESEFNHLFDVFEYLLINPTGKDVDAENVARFINLAEEELKEFYIEAITKTLKIGVSASTLNKIYGMDFINDFDVMLAKKFEDEKHKVVGKEFVLTEKLDGVRCVSIVENNKVKFLSRQGQKIDDLIEIEEEIKKLPDGVYDGELLIQNAGKYKDRDVLQETLKITRKDGNKTGLVLHLFDTLPFDEFKDGKSKDNFIVRKNQLFNLINRHNFNYINVVPNLYVGNNLDVIPELLHKMNAEGKEGLMLNIDGIYATKRTDQLLKIKTMNTMDCKVIGYEEGTGKYKGKLGKIIVDYKGYELGVGSGFTDEDRERIWNNQNDYLNKIMEVQYFRESQNQNGGLSVSFPIYVRMREDKTKPSYY